ncbi:condensation domain-containing protein [Microtetraspora niveoalba]|uniref:condensation domain-containing protein n=1 Tax=Microtetraspora niveoalba TaxID=46175 RepID=UPI00082F4725|nr:condensation domain-containing protein [Microtetraspora niveoalba]
MTPLTAETVEFAGARGGEAPLTWGQRMIWGSTRWLDDRDPYFNLPWTLPVAGAVDLAAVLRAVRRLVERHETLRTAYVETPEGTVQRVARTGTLTVGVYETGERPMTAAKALAAELAATAFDYAGELPVRCAVVVAGGRPRAVALALSHLAVDGWSLTLLATEWPRLLAGDDLPAPARQPLDQAAYESGDEGAARSARALRHWRAGLERAPRSMFDFPGREPEEPRFVRYGMRSAAAAVAAETLAARCAVTTASVLTAASAALLAAVTGHRTAALQLIVSNRHDPCVRDMAAPAALDGLFVLDLAGGGFADAVRRGHGQAMAAYRNGHYDPSAVGAVRAEAGRERGADLDLDAFFNDVRPDGRWPDLPPVARDDPGALAALREKTRTFFVGGYPKVKARVFFATGPATATCEFFVLVDTAFLPGETAERMLLGLEALLVRAVAEEVPIDRVAEVCGLAPVRRPAGWTRVGDDWIEKTDGSGTIGNTERVT